MIKHWSIKAMALMTIMIKAVSVCVCGGGVKQPRNNILILPRKILILKFCLIGTEWHLQLSGTCTRLNTPKWVCGCGTAADPAKRANNALPDPRPNYVWGGKRGEGGIKPKEAREKKRKRKTDTTKHLTATALIMMMNRPVAEKTIPQSLAAVGRHAIKQPVEGAIQSDVFNVRSLPRFHRYLTNLVSHHVHYLQHRHIILVRNITYNNAFNREASPRRCCPRSLCLYRTDNRRPAVISPWVSLHWKSAYGLAWPLNSNLWPRWPFQ